MNHCKTLFLGSPAFAVPSLEKLVQLVEVVGVVTQPDRPAGRGKLLTPPPVKQAALNLGLRVFQLERLRNPDSFAQIAALEPDLIVVTAFGQILRQNVLDLPKYDCINVHASLLPRWRGAAPIQAALLHGDQVTGTTIMKMDAGVDTGPILAQRAEPILADDTAETLSARLAELGADLLSDSLPAYLSGKIQPVPQDETKATYASMLKKEDGELDFTQSAGSQVNKVRAFNPWPGAYTFFRGAPLKVQKAFAAEDRSLPSGRKGRFGKYPAVGCVDSVIAFEIVQPAGKKAMTGDEFLRGARDWIEV